MLWCFKKENFTFNHSFDAINTTFFTYFSGKLTKILEQNYTPVLPNTIETADAIVVLSGMVRSIKKENRIHYEFSDAVDRIIGGMEAFKIKQSAKNNSHQR